MSANTTSGSVASLKGGTISVKSAIKGSTMRTIETTLIIPVKSGYMTNTLSDGLLNDLNDVSIAPPVKPKAKKSSSKSVGVTFNPSTQIQNTRVTTEPVHIEDVKEHVSDTWAIEGEYKGRFKTKRVVFDAKSTCLSAIAKYLESGTYPSPSFMTRIASAQMLSREIDRASEYIIHSVSRQSSSSSRRESDDASSGGVDKEDALSTYDPSRESVYSIGARGGKYIIDACGRRRYIKSSTNHASI